MPNDSAGTRLLLLGATGHVGRTVLDSALADARVASVVAPGRRPPPAHPKLLAPQVDFEALPDAAWWQADAAICTLGSTIKSAGSAEAFRKIDHGYALAAAQRARDAGTSTFVLLTTLGANASSRFLYPRTKGELERDVAALGFASLTLVRPSMIGGRLGPRRLIARTTSVLSTIAAPLLPSDWRMISAETIAHAILESALQARPGQTLLGVSDMLEMRRS